MGWTSGWSVGFGGLLWEPWEFVNRQSGNQPIRSPGQVTLQNIVYFNGFEGVIETHDFDVFHVFKLLSLVPTGKLIFTLRGLRGIPKPKMIALRDPLGFCTHMLIWLF